MRMKATVAIFYVLTFVSGFVAWQLPIHLKAGSSTAVGSPSSLHLTVTLSIVYSLMNGITIGLLFVGLRNFKAEMRRPYRLLCTSLIIMSVAQLQVPIAILTGAYWWLTSGLVLLLYITPNIFLYASMRLFARLLSIKDTWVSFRFTMLVTVTVAALSWLVPIQPSVTATTSAAAHMTIVIPMWQLAVTIVCAHLAWRVKQIMGGAYTHAMRWLFITMVAYALTSVHFLVLSFIGYDSLWYSSSGMYFIAFIVLGTIFIIMGYKFWEIGLRSTVVKNASALDVVMYAASLVTNQREIEPILENVRVITSRITPGSSLESDQEKALGSIYLGIEEYLINREPLRRLSKIELRQRLTYQFPHEQTNPFWVTIAA